jgi:hypothetical protein
MGEGEGAIVTGGEGVSSDRIEEVRVKPLAYRNGALSIETI